MRITETMLKAKVQYLNKITGNALDPYRKNAQGKLVSNIGNYHISFAYGGVSLEQMTNEQGGVRSVFSTGHISKRELFNRLCAYIQGIEEGRQTDPLYWNK